jgi:glycosyltransferase involved in cell wall biosynthesis
MNQRKGVFIVWRQFQRRVEVLAPYLHLEISYLHYSWEEKSKVFKAISFFLKSIVTLKYLFQKKASLVFVQFPPTPALYCVAFYSWLTGSRYVTDCHITTGNEHWLDWIFVKKLLRRNMVVHNDYVVERVINRVNKKPIVLRDGVAKTPIFDRGKNNMLEALGLSHERYLIFPCSFSADEPIMEVVEAARLLPETIFVITWSFERLSNALRKNLPKNILLTGYLEVDDFDCLYADSGIALVLTNQENIQLSGMQEAMAFEIPAVVTDLKTTRLLYKEYPVYVKNEANSIASGVKYAFQNRLYLKERMKKLRAETERVFFDQLGNLKTILNIVD